MTDPTKTHRSVCDWKERVAQIDRSVRLLQLAAINGMYQEPRPSMLRALLVDAAGTLISPSENVAEVYLDYARQYGCNLSEREVLANFRRAFNTPWTRTLLKYEGHGRPFWEFIVEKSTGCNDSGLMEQVYAHYQQPSAWKLAPGAVKALAHIRSTGVKLGVVSNFDNRLRPLLGAMGVAQVFDTMVVSAEVGAEKPNPLIFEIACEQLGVRPEEAVHVGDDRRNDITGARSAGCHAWLWGFDVKSFEDVGAQILTFNQALAAEK